MLGRPYSSYSTPLISCWAALTRLQHVAISHHYDFLKAPNMIAQASTHARSDSQRFVDTGEVVVYGVDRNRCGMILNFLRECVGQSSHSD